MNLNKLKIHFYNLDGDEHLQSEGPDFGVFERIQVTYENVKGWRDNDFTVLAAWDAQADRWILTPQHFTDGMPHMFTDFSIHSPQESA